MLKKKYSKSYILFCIFVHSHYIYIYTIILISFAKLSWEKIEESAKPEVRNTNNGNEAYNPNQQPLLFDNFGPPGSFRITKSLSKKDRKMFIDIWTTCITTSASESDYGSRWKSYPQSFNLCLQLAHTLRMTSFWGKNTKKRIISLVLRDSDVDNEFERLARFLEEINFKADILVRKIF